MGHQSVKSTLSLASGLLIYVISVLYCLENVFVRLLGALIAPRSAPELCFWAPLGTSLLKIPCANPGYAIVKCVTKMRT